MKKLATSIPVLFIASIFPVQAICGLAIMDELWSKPEITICWAAGGEKYHECDNGNGISVKPETATPRPTAFRQYKDLVQTIVSAEYRVDRVGISFVGWDDCPSEGDVGDKADLIITLNAETLKPTNSWPVSGFAHLGACKQDPDSPKRVPTISLTVPEGGAWPYRINKNYSLQMIALHEFGHVAGLLHEDRAIGQSKKSLREYGMQLIGEYNPLSIMSYHFRDLVLNFGFRFNASELNGKLNGDYHNTLSALGWDPNGHDVILKAGLSTGDIHTLRCLYQLNSRDCD
jgi:hypothetical protein